MSSYTQLSGFGAVSNCDSILQSPKKKKKYCSDNIDLNDSESLLNINNDTQTIKNYYSQDFSQIIENDYETQQTADVTTEGSVLNNQLRRGGSYNNFIFLNCTYPLNKTYQKLISTGFFIKNNITKLGIGLIKSGRQIIFSAEEWSYLQLNINELRIKHLLNNKVYSKKSDLSKDLQISITFYFGEWRINLTRSSLYIRITLNRSEWELIDSLTTLLNNHYNYLKLYEDEILRQIDTGILPSEGTIFKQLQQELAVYKLYLS